jgi:predicted secreted hydrolase
MNRRVLRRTAMTALALSAPGAGVAFAANVSLAAPAPAPVLRPVSLPRDHGAHAGFAVEWWYTAGTVHGSDAHRYFWFATMVPSFWEAPAAITRGPAGGCIVESSREV